MLLARLVPNPGAIAPRPQSLPPQERVAHRAPPSPLAPRPYPASGSTSTGLITPTSLPLSTTNNTPLDQSLPDFTDSGVGGHDVSRANRSHGLAG